MRLSCTCLSPAVPSPPPLFRPGKRTVLLRNALPWRAGQNKTRHGIQMSSIALVSRCRSPGLKLRLLLTGFSWHKSKASWRQQVKRLAGPVSFGLLLGWLLLSTITQHRMLGLREQLQDAYEYQRAPVLISYAYFEKDEIQAANFDFFLRAGLGMPFGQDMHWTFVVSTPVCTPCNLHLPHLMKALKPGPEALGVSQVAEAVPHTLMFRTRNVGMDLGSHNVTLSYFEHLKRLWHYKYFFLINSSTRGPFYPTFMPPHWHWTHAFMVRFQGPAPDVHAVSSSLTCLPSADAGGPGPRPESWALALDTQGLQALLDAGALQIRACKVCPGPRGIVVAGEYGIGSALLGQGLNVATLMLKYSTDVDWRQQRHWACNNHVHPSRHGTYDGVSFHPFETVFVKSSWHVADPYTAAYTRWVSEHVAGGAGTAGKFNYYMYRYAISEVAQRPHPDLQAAYNVTPCASAYARDEDLAGFYY